MPQWLIWVLIALGGVIALYLLGFFIALFIISKFNKRLRKRRDALRLLIAQRKDIALAVYKLVAAENAKIPMSVQNKVNELANKGIGLLNDYEVLDYAPEIEKITKTIFELADASKTLKKSEDCARYRKELTELDEIKRQHIAIYNSDINGYNYWIRLMSYRLLLSALGFHEKKRIE